MSAPLSAHGGRRGRVGARTRAGRRGGGVARTGQDGANVVVVVVVVVVVAAAAAIVIIVSV